MFALFQETDHAIEGLPPQQKLVAVVLAVAMLVTVIELVRRRKLREEYSYLWVGTGILLLVLALAPQLLSLFQRAIGAVMPTSALFFGALVFLMLVALQFSIRISRLTLRNKALSQKVALLEQDLEELRARLEERSEGPAGTRENAERPPVATKGGAA